MGCAQSQVRKFTASNELDNKTNQRREIYHFFIPMNKIYILPNLEIALLPVCSNFIGIARYTSGSCTKVDLLVRFHTGFRSGFSALPNRIPYHEHVESHRKLVIK